jgi:hypothetical protein
VKRQRAYIYAALVIIAVAAAALLLAVQPSHRTARNPDIVFGADGGSMNYSQMAYARRMGIKYDRLDIEMNGSFHGYVENLTRNNISVLGIIDYRTMNVSFSSSKGVLECTSNCNWTLGEWNNTVSNVIRAYPMIHVWEIWNEPQFTGFQDGFNNGSVHDYYLMLKSAYTRIKEYNHNDTVLCLGGDNIYEGGSTPWMYGYYWAEQLWSYGAGSYCSAISLHAYTGFEYLPSQVPYGSSRSVASIFNQSLSMYENLTGKPIWITEVGIPSNNGTGVAPTLDNSYLKQSEFLNQTFDLFASKPYIAGIFWFNINGYIDRPYNLSMGLFTRNFTPKPALYAFRSQEDRN